MIRNAKRSQYLELLFVSAVTSIFGTRLFLQAAGYPQISGNGLHIAHMLWGGALMLVSVVLLLSYLSERVMWVSAMLSGIGFGLFIDELGKFITADNNYFFKPALAIIYLIFVVLLIIFRRIGQNQLNERELKKLNKLDKIKLAVNKIFASRVTQILLRIYFILQALFAILSIALFIILELSQTQHVTSPIPSSDIPLVGVGVVATVLMSIFTVLGVSRLPLSRELGYKWFLRATLINLLILQPIAFYTQQIGATLGFAINLATYLILVNALGSKQINPEQH
jgi:hypothetical protein